MKLEVNNEEAGWLVLSLDGEVFRRVSAPLFRKKITQTRFSSNEEFLDSFSAIERRAAREEGYRLLAVRGLLSESLIDKLQKKGISKEFAVEAAEELKRQGYINNERWLCSFIDREFQKGTGPLGILAKLWEKKVGNDAAGRLVRERISFQAQLEKIELLIQTKYANRPRQKVLSSLERKGFDRDAILQVVAKSF